MTEKKQDDAWAETTFEGSRRAHLREALKLTIRERLEAMDRLNLLSEKMQKMPKRPVSDVEDEQPAYKKPLPEPDLVLDGCNPTPLASYLKTLGVLRLLSAKYPETRGYWRSDRFVLRTSLSLEDICRFFLEDYEPTPILSPWNAGSGFYFREKKSKSVDPKTGKKKKLGIFDEETTATKIVSTIIESRCVRFAPFRKALIEARRVVSKLGFVQAPSESEKRDLLIRLRALVPDDVVAAIDVGVVVQSMGNPKFAPIVGTGWNLGNMDISSNFMQRALEVLDEDNRGQSDDWIRSSLFDSTIPSLISTTVGQFIPARAGGANATAGFQAGPTTNPWDIVFMVEGALLFSGAIVRRSADDPIGTLSFPFTVQAVDAGSGSLGTGDTESASGELWMPIWNRAASHREISFLFSEGRAALRRKPARDALDFVRAAHQLGVDRGITGFQRFSILKRFGQSNLAAATGSSKVSRVPQTSLIDDLDNLGWLDRFRRHVGNKAPNSLKSIRRRLEDSLFVLSGIQPRPVEVQSILVLLGQIQLALSKRLDFCVDADRGIERIPPVPTLPMSWAHRANDGSTEFRIAAALAGLRGDAAQPFPLKSQLFPIERSSGKWITSGSKERIRIRDQSCGRLVSKLSSLLHRRLWVAEQVDFRDKPLGSPFGATVDDVNAFLRDDRMDTKIEELLFGLSLCVIPKDLHKTANQGQLPAAFGLMKMALTPDQILRSLGYLGRDEYIPLPKDMVSQLASGNDRRAVSTALRRLRSASLGPPTTLPSLAGLDPRRAAAALLIPLDYAATARTARQLLKEPEIEYA